jgi:PAS domain-containing protein
MSEPTEKPGTDSPSGAGREHSDAVARGIVGGEALLTTDTPAAIGAINQRIFDTSLDLILVVDRRGTLLRVSPSALAIRSPACGC